VSNDDNETTSDTEPIFHLVAFEGVHYDLAAPAPLLHFRESEGEQRPFVIAIGVADAIAIAAASQGRTSPRPSSSDLLSIVLESFGADIIAVRFVRVEGGVVFTELDVMSNVGRRIFDCRPSDAVALALRSPSTPVLVNTAIVESLAGR